MLEVILLFGKLVLIGLMYLFLFAVVRAGLAVVSSGPSASGAVFGLLGIRFLRQVWQIEVNAKN